MKYMKANVIFEFFVRRFLLVLVFSCALTLSAARAQTLAQTTHEVLFETTKGKIRIALYDDTPIHRDNFIKLVKEGFYDGLLFHRVIYNFMIQTGDTASRHARPGELLGSSAEGYKLRRRYCIRNCIIRGELLQLLVKATMLILSGIPPHRSFILYMENGLTTLC